MYRRRDGRVTTDGWLLWWGVSTVGIFTLTGNHGWYLLPAFVPGALLVAGLFDDALTGHLGALAGTTAGAALLLTHSFRIDGISPVATAKPMIHVTDGLPFVGLTLLGIVVVAVTGVHERTDLVRLAPTRVRRVLDNRWSRRLLAVGLFLCRIAVVVAPTNPAYQHGGTSQVDIQQHALAVTLNDQLDSDESVYITETATTELSLFTFGFYIDAPLATVPKAPLDYGYLVAVEPAANRVTLPTAAGGTQAVVAAAVELPDGRLLVAYELGPTSQSP